MILPGVPTKARLSWVPSPEEDVLYTVDLSFSALEPAKEQGGDMVRWVYMCMCVCVYVGGGDMVK